jgi:hypothetical protein
MNTYVRTTGLLFGLLTAVHVWRMLEERELLTEPWYLAVTATAAALALWAWRLLSLTRRKAA